MTAFVAILGRGMESHLKVSYLPLVYTFDCNALICDFLRIYILED